MSRRATIRTGHDVPELLARALCPDNTSEMETAVEDGTVLTHIERETTGGLHSTVDDYVVNLEVAIDVAHTAGRAAQHDEPTDAGLASDSDTNDINTTNE